MKIENSPLANSKSQKAFVINKLRNNGFNNSVINPEMCETLYNDSLKLVEKFYFEFQNNANMESNTFFKNYNKSELYNTFRELNLQKEFLNKMIGNIDRFITYGVKYIEKHEFEKVTPSTDFSELGDKKKLASITKQKLKDCLANGLWSKIAEKSNIQKSFLISKLPEDSVNYKDYSKESSKIQNNFKKSIKAFAFDTRFEFKKTLNDNEDKKPYLNNKTNKSYNMSLENIRKKDLIIPISLSASYTSNIDEKQSKIKKNVMKKENSALNI